MKLFTPEEANEALDVVRPLTERLVGHRRAFVASEGELGRFREKIAGDGGGLDHRRLRELEAAAAEASGEIERALEALAALGVQVKDLDTGLVDFPATHPGDGERVLLCWRLGEERVGYWHGIEAGFAGRKPLPF